MSTDWDKYSTSEQCRDRGKVPAANGVVELSVCDVRAIVSLTVAHSPDLPTENRSHTDVKGQVGDEEVRIKLKRAAFLRIPPD